MNRSIVIDCHHVFASASGVQAPQLTHGMKLDARRQCFAEYVPSTFHPNTGSPENRRSPVCKFQKVSQFHCTNVWDGFCGTTGFLPSGETSVWSSCFYSCKACTSCGAGLTSGEGLTLRELDTGQGTKKSRFGEIIVKAAEKRNSKCCTANEKFFNRHCSCCFFAKNCMILLQSMCGGVKAKTRTESDHPDAKFYSTNCWEACCCGLSLKSFIGRSRVASGNFCQTIRRHGKFMLRLPWSGEGAPVADIGFLDDFVWCWGHWSD